MALADPAAFPLLPVNRSPPAVEQEGPFITHAQEQQEEQPSAEVAQEGQDQVMDEMTED